MPEFAPHNMTSDSAPAPFVASASSEFNGTLAAFAAFDGLPGGVGQYWIGTGGGVDWLRIKLPWKYVLTSYTVKVNTIPEAARAPKDWTMEGTPDGGSTWVALDTEAGQIAWTSGEARPFTAAAAGTSYDDYRLNISANNGDATFTQVAELYLIGDIDLPNAGVNVAKALLYTVIAPSPIAPPSNVAY